MCPELDLGFEYNMSLFFFKVGYFIFPLVRNVVKNTHTIRLNEAKEIAIHGRHIY